MIISNKREQKEFTHSAEHEKSAAKLKKYLIDVYIVDDHQMVCEGLSELINNSGKAHVSHTFNTLEACRQALQEQLYVSPQVEAILQKGKTNSVVLTDVEKNILGLICDGMTNPEIATHLHLSTETVNWYRKRLLAKFGVRNTVNLLRHAMEQKLV